MLACSSVESECRVTNPEGCAGSIPALVSNSRGRLVLERDAGWNGTEQPLKNDGDGKIIDTLITVPVGKLQVMMIFNPNEFITTRSNPRALSGLRPTFANPGWPRNRASASAFPYSGLA